MQNEDKSFCSMKINLANPEPLVSMCAGLACRGAGCAGGTCSRDVCKDMARSGQVLRPHTC